MKTLAEMGSSGAPAGHLMTASGNARGSFADYTANLIPVFRVTRWGRKHANKVLFCKRRSKDWRGREEPHAGMGALKACWLAMEQPCGKRMKDMLPLWVRHLDCLEAVKVQLKEISAASIDRLLRGLKIACSLTYPCEGLNISFIGLEALLRNKVASGRPKDLIDVEALTKQKT